MKGASLIRRTTHRTKRNVLAVLFGVIALFATPAESQQVSGGLTGRVIDSQGGVVPGATVTITNNETSVSITFTTDASGSFTASGLPVGRYSVKVTYQGFKTYTNPAVVVSPGKAARLTIPLNLGVPGLAENVAYPPTTLPFGSPTWNVWTETYHSPDPAYAPEHVKAGKPSLLVIDLAAFAFDSSLGNGVYSSQASETFNRWIASSKKEPTTVTVLIVPDSRFFQRQDSSEKVKPLVVNLAKIESAQNKGFKLTSDPFRYLARHHGNAPFDYTDKKASFMITAKSHVSGPAPIAVSLWVDGKPVDELAYSACIDDGSVASCPKTMPEDVLDGVDISNHDSKPDVALHLVELGSDNAIGVYRCNVCGWDPTEFKYWTMGRSLEWFRHEFLTSVLPNIQQASVGADAAASAPGSPEAVLTAQYDEGLMNTTGEYLYNLLFHQEDPGPNDAEVAFRDFVAKHAKQDDATAIAPSLFVRLLPTLSDQNFIVPVQLARVKVPDQGSVFLGFVFRVEEPLELQDYSSGAGCIKQWEVLVPPDNLTDNPLADARSEFSSWIDTFKVSRDAEVYENLDTFNSVWLNPAQNNKPANDVVLILTHNQGNTLHFDPDDDGIAPVMSRRYATASLVVLGACATANPGAFEFVREFNSHGANSIIASSIDVDAKLGGLFLETLIDKISSGNQNYTIDRAVFDTFRDLQKQPDNFPAASKPYGARVLIFNLAGNGDIHVCAPPKPQTPR
jgi:hypothetical protein